MDSTHAGLHGYRANAQVNGAPGKFLLYWDLKANKKNELLKSVVHPFLLDMPARQGSTGLGMKGGGGSWLVVHMVNLIVQKYHHALLRLQLWQTVLTFSQQNVAKKGKIIAVINIYQHILINEHSRRVKWNITKNMEVLLKATGNTPYPFGT